MKIKFLIYTCLLFLSAELSAQATIGTIVNSKEALTGYTFFSPFNSTSAYMVDNCGNLINKWDRGTKPGLSAYFLDNGLMLRTYKVNTAGPFTSASNAGGLELVDWDNNTVWSYELNTPEALSHHDAVMMPNGNILLLTWELIYEEELIALGRDPNEIAPQKYAWNEKIIEVEPVGSSQANVVWEWKIKDHYIQDLDPTKSNFGEVEDHPELFDINLPDLYSTNSHSTLDYNHFNAIDYNEELDQILISVRNSDEIWILDHSTTIAEAASHEGGKYGKGGDILYRWGNGSAYQRADIEEQILFGQHGTHWIKEGDDKGKILIFNNGNERPYDEFSVIEILEPDQNTDGSYNIESGAPFGPRFPDTAYGYGIGENFFSPYLSNAQILANGNILINEGSNGRIFEIDENGDIVWEYKIPLIGDFPATQGGFINNNATFRSYKYAKNYAGFEGIDITPGDPIEINPLPCEILSSIEIYPAFSDLEIVLTQENGILYIQHSHATVLQLAMFDFSGKKVLDESPIKYNQEIKLPGKMMSGIYLLHFTDGKGDLFTEKLFIP